MELKNFFAQDDAGNILSAATCYLYVRGTENLATGLVKSNGTNLVNPFVTGADGLTQLAAPNGLYDLRVVKGARDYRLVLQFNDVAETVAIAQSAAGRAELARDIAQLSAGIFLNTTAGLAATASGRYFSVPSDISSEYLILYLNSSGVAVEKKRYPSAQSVASTRAQWLAGDADSSSAVTQVLDAISTLRIKGGSKTRTYRISVVAKNDVTHADRLQITDDQGSTWSFTGTAAGKDDGPVSLILTGAAGTSFVVIIDYRKITANGVIFNSTVSMALKLSPRIFELADVETVVSAVSVDVASLSAKYQKWWRDAASTTLVSTMHLEVQAAVLAVRANGADKTKAYRITLLCKDDAALGDRLFVQDAGALNTWSFNGSVLGKANGPVWVTLTKAASNVSFDLLIDYRQITTTGIVLNTPNELFKLSPQIFEWELLREGFDEALAPAVAAADAAGAGVADVRARFPKPWRDLSATTTVGASQAQVLASILTVRAKNGDKTKQYKVAVLCKDDVALKDRLIIQSIGAPISSWTFDGEALGKAAGPVWVKAIKAGSDTSFDVLIDYRQITTTGIILNTTGELFKLSSQIFEWDRLRAEFPAVSPVAPVAALARAIRVSVAGSSITWGQGWLGEDSYVGDIERHLRTVLATTLHGADFVLTGTSATVSNKLFYKGSAVRLQGASSEASFDLYGDELSLCIARERGNAGAALVEVYADGTLLDTFSTWNDVAAATGLSASFVGDGTTRQFDLGQAFTYGHGVTVAGVAKVVQMNTGGYGAGFPAGVDVLVIRKLVTVGGVPQVRHFLWFATAPVNGAAIAATFSAGESVTYVRGTIGQTTQALTSANESPYGDGNVAFDPANPANLSSGLGFRETDPRSVVSWNFATTAKRTFRVKIVGLDPRATGTPQLYLNAATNRMHHLQNAGIGGWTAALLLNDNGLNNVAAVQRFQPDVLLFESCTNDDWQTHVDRAWRSRIGLTDTQVRGDETSHWFHTVTYVGPDNYNVEDNRMLITAITETSVTFDGTAATFEVVPGDVVILGDFKGDNRRLACRVVKGWDAVNRRLTWARPLNPRELVHIGSLGDLVGSTAMVKGAPTWVANVEAVIEGMRAAVPECVIALGTGGIPNFYNRRLEGYRELAADIARRKGVLFEDFYARTLAWQYSQPATTQLYLDASQGAVSSGAAAYTLYLSNGSKPTPLTDGNAQLYRGWSVKVDGVERINRGCHVEGGYKSGWPSGTAQMSKGNVGVVGDDYRLVFESAAPAAGATIVVKRAGAKWANDDTHPGTAGIPVFGQAAIAALASAATTAAGVCGMKR
ncbi:hypothetical protein [Pseudomonas bubulae]|uniref:hypothetical protein n=1 Tax=Pseudomonas bubulae TaxID=2316085 RepID=UPI0039A2AC5C